MHRKAPPLRIFLTAAISIILALSFAGLMTIDSAQAAPPTVTHVGHAVDADTLGTFALGASTLCVGTNKDHSVVFYGAAMSQQSGRNVNDIQSLRVMDRDVIQPLDTNRSVAKLAVSQRVVSSTVFQPMAMWSASMAFIKRE